ncbi:MAG: Rad52/Rad22 family DNA repair protein [Campylobacterota bacterium]
MFNQEQLQLLNQELDSSRVKSRSKGNINLSYLEGFDLIETANKVFGYGNWSYSIESLEHLSTEQNQNQNFVICYKAIVKITVYDKEHIQNISRSDVGTGTGIAKSQSEAHEGATKEAVTDALKRALRSFGNQFGLSLYDKSRNYTNNNSYNQPPQQNYQPNNQQPRNQTRQSYQHQNDFSALINAGLQIIDNGDILTVAGDGIFEKKEIIKNAGFRWNGQNRVWYMQKREVA